MNLRTLLLRLTERPARLIATSPCAVTFLVVGCLVGSFLCLGAFLLGFTSFKWAVLVSTALAVVALRVSVLVDTFIEREDAQ